MNIRAYNVNKYFSLVAIVDYTYIVHQQTRITHVTLFMSQKI